MTQIPEQIKKLSDSPKIFESIDKLAKKFDLNIDQEGELGAEIRGILLGLNKTSDFTENITKRLEIDTVLAEQITEEANKEIFVALKNEFKSQELNSQFDKSTLEQAGNFTIEPEKKGVEAHNDVMVEDRDKILLGIEKINADTHTESMIDHLLTTPTAQPEQKVVRKVEQKPINPPKLAGGIDPYREAVK